MNKNYLFLIVGIIIVISVLVIGYVNIFHNKDINNPQPKKIMPIISDSKMDTDQNSGITTENSIINDSADLNQSSDISIQDDSTEQEIEPEKIMYSPGEYATITGCNPFFGDSNKPLKIIIANLDNSAYFDETKANIVNNELKEISPFKENIDKIAVYSININSTDLDCSNYSMGLSGSGFTCDNSKIYSEIRKQCNVDSFDGIITIAIADSNYGGSGGDVIYVGSNPNVDKELNLAFKKNVAIHEIGHNFGLGDLYFGMIYFDGSPSQFLDTNFSRSFLNVDGPGCAKWCNSYKPVSEYTESISAECLTFTEKQDCISFGRREDRSCEYNGNDITCCVWSEQKFEYFNTNCVPAIGTENIGRDCLEGSGCYFGAMYGNYAWRPVNSQGFSESIMYGLSTESFDSVSERELSKVFKCCLSEESSSSECTDYRKTYSDFLYNINFKKRIGSCGYKE